MSDIERMLTVVARAEALAETSPDWACTWLANLLADFRPQFATAAIRGDQRAFAAALTGLELMVRRCLMAMSL